MKTSLALVALALLLPGAATFADDTARSKPRWLKRSASTSVMGTSLEVAVIGTDVAILDEAILAAIAELRRVEKVFTTWDPNSVVSQLNRRAGQRAMAMSQEVIALIAAAEEISKLTGGAFDITWGSVGKLWDFKSKKAPTPTAQSIRQALLGVGYTKIVADSKAGTIELPPGTTIGFGGIAKGYGVDRAIEVLRKRGIKNAIVNAGGDLRAIGRDLDRPFNVTLKHPRAKDEYLAILPVANVSVVTSGDYERFVMIDGKRYSHILDPRTGWPVDHTQAVTLLASTACRADALATGVFILGPEKGMALVEELADVEALIVDGRGKLTLSSGLAAGAKEKKILHLRKRP